MAWPDLKWVERFAPSPTGPLHLGHAFSALTAWDRALENGGEFILRIEDIDQSRCRPKWESQIFEDLNWLGISWPAPVLRQSERLGAYREALEALWARGLIYPCYCTRKDILGATMAPQEGANPMGPDGIIYPGTCRAEPKGKMPNGLALRLNLAAAVNDKKFSFEETGLNAGLIEFSADDAVRTIGDIVLARRDMGTSYHLSVVLDDAFQGVTHVTRGQDLFEATKIHVILQKLLGLPTPAYYHHALVRDKNGKRLAKRDDARAIAKYRAEGATPEDIRRMVGL